MSGSLSMKPAKNRMGEESSVKDAASLRVAPLTIANPIRVATAITTKMMPIRRCCVR